MTDDRTGIIAAAVLRLEDATARIAARLEQIAGMIELLNARVDRLGHGGG